MDYSLLQLRRDQPEALPLFEQLLARIRAMSHRCGGNAVLLSNQVWNLFAADSPLLGLWLAFHRDVVIGHALGQVQSWDGRLVGWVHQVEMSTVAGQALKDKFLVSLEQWVQTANVSLKPTGQSPITELMMVTRRTPNALFDHWSRHAGFDPYLVIYRRPVKGAV